MTRFGFAIDNRACIGCHACTVACKSEHSVPLGVNRTWVKYIEKGEFPNTRRLFSVQRCNHCEDAPCVDICPVTSLYKRPDGIVDFDPQRCIACKACMQACPYDALYLDPETQTAAKCNYCTHRVDQGFEPACVVICPVEAIVSGDLDDPNSRIAKLDLQLKVQYPKPEKGTKPKLFYVGGDTAQTDPTAAPPAANYLWSGNAADMKPAVLEAARDEAEDNSRARRVYDPRSKPAPWGWMVSAYITTKAVATGLPLVTFALFWLGLSKAAAPTSAVALALLFLAATGALLVGDLKQPQRFLYVLLRPQWKSWLVRGAYLILGFSLLLPLTWLLGVVGAGTIPQLAVGYAMAAFAVTSAIYTAFLLAQAKGRDAWQNPLLAPTMLADALACGLVFAIWLGLMNWSGGTLTIEGQGATELVGRHSDPPRVCLGITTLVLGLLLSAESLAPHATRGASFAAHVALRGSLSGWFWGGAVVAGLVVPALLLLCGAPVGIAGLLILVGIAAKNHVLIQAPQRVPLS